MCNNSNNNSNNISNINVISNNNVLMIVMKIY